MARILRYAPITRRRFLTNSALAVGAASGAGALLEACSSSTNNKSSSSSNGVTTLTVMYGISELTKDEISFFEKQNPDIKIKQLEYDATRLNAMLAAGEPPDFIRTQGAPEMPNLIARGLALDLTPYFEKSKVLKVDDLEPINDVYRWDGAKQGQGARYGGVKDWSQDIMLWYNKKVFDQAKIPYPSSTKPMTYDELLELGKKLTVRQGGKVQVYGLDAEWGFIMQGHILQMLAQEGKSLFNSDYTQADFTTPEVRKILQWYVDWARARIGPSPLDPDASGDGPLFSADRLGIAMFGYWFGGYISSDKKLPDHVGLAPAPLWGTQRISACMAGTGFWIPKKSKHQDQAWRFMEYFMGGQPAHDRAKSGWGIPALKSLVSEMPLDMQFQKDAFQVQQKELPYLSILRFSPYANYNAVEAAITKYIEPVMKGQTTLDAGIQQLNSAVNDLLKQGKEQVG